jgi:hypothetical protein
MQWLLHLYHTMPMLINGIAIVIAVAIFWFGGRSWNKKHPTKHAAGK